MKCPLFVMAASRIARSQAPEYIGCIKEECAWWEKGINECGFNAIKEALQMIAICLKDIVEKMPHERQVRK